MAKASYEVDYNDKRFTKVENAREEALSDLEKTYAGMIDKSDKYYQDQIDASQKWADRQSALQQEKTDFAIQKIEQQKQQAQKDYTKEQSGAYVDWQKQSDQYGAKAEQMASQGMAGTGYSESSQVSMYNTYQNRVMTARDAYQRAILNYDNSITEARLQNNSLLAEIAYNALQKQLELSLQGFQYKNTLILDKTAKKLEVDQMYDNRYQNVLAQINHENAMAEQIRQYNESQALEREKMAEQIRQFNASLAEDQRQFNETMAYNKAKSAGSGSTKKFTDNSKKAMKKITDGVIGAAKKVVEGVKGNKEVTAEDYFNAMYRDGASKSDVANAISRAHQEGAIDTEEMVRLRKIFTPRGVEV